ncbi:hypothetical protein SO694_00002754 [Aureococcus anophagefferens]|uniref:Plastid lipid-associated protein/fibrillin conserved domain-containing protein n=1 Tax=Aureococcus anophagefferens TaxID=44056 RepID=A0ABR1GD69_AURAN
MGDDVTRLKAQILHYGATLDRGQGYNPTSGDQYKGKMDAAIAKVDELVARSTGAVADPAKLEGRWELVFSSVPHGIFRSSPFFLAIEEAYRRVGTPEKASLFFKLHELQTCSWGASKIGRVSQTVDVANKMLYSEFDTQLFSLTVIPVLGWFKLLPTFGGCVVTASKLDVQDASLELEVDYTTAKPVEGLSGLGEWIWKVKVPVGAVWKLLPWNKGNAPTASVACKYLDDDFRVVQDAGGEYFCYARPV